jgi:hypothetical protein
MQIKRHASSIGSAFARFPGRKAASHSAFYVYCREDLPVLRFEHLTHDRRASFRRGVRSLAAMHEVNLHFFVLAARFQVFLY